MAQHLNHESSHLGEPALEIRSACHKHIPTPQPVVHKLMFVQTSSPMKGVLHSYPQGQEDKILKPRDTLCLRRARILPFILILQRLVGRFPPFSESLHDV